MYWIYLVVFALMISVPHFIWRDFLFLDEEGVEGVIIFILGMIGLMVFLKEEKELKINFRRRIKVQKESNRIFHDLNDAYSYIGEVNRKLEIMKRTSLAVAENIGKNDKIAFRPLFEAFEILAKSGKILIRLIEVESQKTVKEVKTEKRLFLELDNHYLLEKKENFLELENRFIIKSPHPVKGLIAVVAITRTKPNWKIDDPELMKALTSQALRLFILSGDDKKQVD